MALDENSSLQSKWKYHVFLSFRGEDTRYGFTDHLYAALKRSGIVAFRDDEELPRGEVISPKLLDSIEKSLSAIVIISENYASSTWCLDELQKIIESKEKLGREVFPIFYGVKPSHLRDQKGSFEEAFSKHEEKFAENKEKVQKWRDALKDVANLSGWDSKNKYETELIEEIVAEVWKKLELKLPTYVDGLVAIDSKVEDLLSHLRLRSADVLFMGIWGMSGIGKTTLAEVVFNKIRSQFDVCCFLNNVTETSEYQHQGLVHLQKRLFSEMNLGSMIIETTSQGKDKIRNLLNNKKVLLVLDDVSDESQLENLAGNQEWFGSGSRIIVTTKDKRPLISCGVLSEMYEIKTLNTDESLRLFCERAFKRDQPKEGYLRLSKTAVEYAGGLPLALKVLGSMLCERSIQDWKDILDQIKRIPPDGILEKLKISFDLLDDEYKIIFLDIACFFKGWYKDKVIEILDTCGLHTALGIKVLIEKSLVTCDEKMLGMHDLLEKMGKNMVCQQSLNDHGRHSRLFSLEDIDQVLNKNMGAEEVKGIVLKSSSESYKAFWYPKSFSKMSNLRSLIILCDLDLPYGLKCLSSSLNILIWMGCPLKTLPLGVQLDELVHLQMHDSNVKKLWKGTQSFRKLKVIDLRNSDYLIKTPDVSDVPNLEELLLDDCESLVEVHKSVGQHKKLARLSLESCDDLRILPSKLEMSSLKILNLALSSRLRRLPDFGENMECLSVLNLESCDRLVRLPNTISNLKSLKSLNLSSCKSIYSLPDSISENTALEDLDLSYTSIREVNSSLLQLKNLKRLSFRGCGGPAFGYKEKRLPFGWMLPMGRLPNIPTYLKLPAFVSSLYSLTHLDLSYCNLSCESLPKDIGHLSSLERLVLSGNEDLVLPAASIANLSKLRCLELKDCKLLDRFKLPPHVCIYQDDFAMEASLLHDLDLCKLWNVFESNDNELFESHKSKSGSLTEDQDEHLYCFEVPPVSDNDNFFHLGPRLSNFQSSASITVDIPDECYSGEWWGIAVFIALEPLNPSIYCGFMRLLWCFEAPSTEAGPSLYLCTSFRAYGNPYLLTMLIWNNCICFGRNQCGYRTSFNKSNDIQTHWKPKFNEKTRFRCEVLLCGRGKIRECSWHVLSKEDFRVKALPVNTPDSEGYSSFNNSTVTQFEEGSSSK